MEPELESDTMNRIRQELKSALTITANSFPEGFEAEFTLPPDFVGFRHHFPGNPVLPGVAIIDAVAAACSLAAGTTSSSIKRIKRAKFFTPVKPDMTVRMGADIKKGPGSCSISATLHSDGTRIAIVKIEMNDELSARSGMNGSD
ncbi:MAG: hypothetical protein ACOCR1_01365 [Planctomycetota bacterium]